MDDSERDEKHLNKEQGCKLVKNSRTGSLVISGPSFTKEDVDRDFPKGSGRNARVMRKSVRLQSKEMINSYFGAYGVWAPYFLINFIQCVPKVVKA